MTKFQAKLSAYDVSSSSDEYDPTVSRIPCTDFVISRDKIGNIVSTYGDMSWDLTPYHNKFGDFNLHFKYWNKEAPTSHRHELASELRWYMFILIFLRPGHPLSFSTLRNYIHAFYALARFCEKNAIGLSDLLNNSKLLIQALTEHIPWVKILAPFLRLVKELGPTIVGFSVVEYKEIKRLHSLGTQYASDAKQHPPIPPRIYSLILSTLSKELDEFDTIADRILDLFKYCASCPLNGRDKPTQWRARKKLGMEHNKFRPKFDELLKSYNLEEWWQGMGYTKSIHGLSEAITNTYTLASLQIQAFTGMRHSELRTLPLQCLKEVTREEDGQIHYLVEGQTTKLTHGKAKRVQWVTSESGRRAIKIAQRIALSIYSVRGDYPSVRDVDKIDSHVLFISPFHANNRFKHTPAPIKLESLSRLRTLIQPIIQDEDLLILEGIDMHRAWRSEKAFEIGQPWKFTTHQLRRSLALYAHRSGLVSLPSLKRQLQHITHEMTLYYAQGSANSSDFISRGKEEKHISQEWKETQPVSQFLSYTINVLLADNSKLFGVHPYWIKNRLRNSDGIVELDRQITLKKFKRGEMAYRETLLGGCVKIGTCDKNPLDLLHTDCIDSHCKNFVGNKKKLERVISAQTNFVKNLANIDPESAEYRHEKINLSVLKSALNSIS